MWKLTKGSYIADSTIFQWHDSNTGSYNSVYPEMKILLLFTHLQTCIMQNSKEDILKKFGKQFWWPLTSILMDQKKGEKKDLS